MARTQRDRIGKAFMSPGVEDAAIGQEARRYAMRANMDAAKAIELARHLTALYMPTVTWQYPCQGSNKW